MEKGGQFDDFEIFQGTLQKQKVGYSKAAKMESDDQNFISMYLPNFNINIQHFDGEGSN